LAGAAPELDLTPFRPDRFTAASMKAEAEAC